MVSFLTKAKILYSGQKPWTIIRCFDQNLTSPNITKRISSESLAVRIRLWERAGGSAPSSRQTDASQPVFSSLECVTIGSRRLVLAAKSSPVG